MVLSPAPNSRRPAEKTRQDASVAWDSSSDNWTHGFRKASALRARTRLTIWTLAVCGILAPVSLINSQAQENNSVDSQQNTPNTSQTAQSSSTQLQAPAQPISEDSEKAGEREGIRPEISTGTVLAAEATVTVPSGDALSNTEAASSLAAEKSILGSEASGSEKTSQASTPAPAKIRFRVQVDGKTRQTEIAVTPKMTVGGALIAMGVVVSTLDRCTPSLAETVRDGMTAKITRVKAELKTRKELIYPEVRYKLNPYLAPGQKQTVQQPKAGTFEITERVWSKDGKVTKREFVSRKVATWPKHRIIALGVKPHLMPNAIAPNRRYALSYRGGSPRDRMIKPANPGTFAATKPMTMHSTGYAAGRAGGAISNWTATGVRCTYGAVAVDPRVIPLGTKLYIEGYGYGFACDTGGAIRGRRVDLAFDSPRQAFRHGRKNVKVWVLGPG